MNSKQNKIDNTKKLQKSKPKSGSKHEQSKDVDTDFDEQPGTTNVETPVSTPSQSSSSVASAKRRRRKTTNTEPSRRSNRIKYSKSQEKAEQSQADEKTDVADSAELSRVKPNPIVLVCDSSQEKKGSSSASVSTVTPEPPMETMNCTKCNESSIFWVKILECGHLLCDQCVYSASSKHISTSHGNDFLSFCPACKRTLLSEHSVLRWKASTCTWRTTSFLFKNGNNKHKTDLAFAIWYGTHLTLENKYKSFTWSLYDQNMTHSFDNIGNKYTILTPAAIGGKLVVEIVDTSVIAGVDKDGSISEKKVKRVRITDGFNVHLGESLLVNGIRVLL